MTWGALVRPTDSLRIGLAWRSPLRISTDGDGTVSFPGGDQIENMHHDQTWPQAASLGVGWQATRELRFATQLDWTEWSEIHELAIRFPANPGIDQVYDEDWRDNWTVRAGGELRVSPALAVRAGGYFDTAAVPDRTLERQYLDSNKLGVAAGASFEVAGWRLDAAVDLVPPRTRSVADNASAPPSDRNKAPGDYRGTLLTFEAAVSRRL
jgi:long-chain fatty acid transport protein